MAKVPKSLRFSEVGWAEIDAAAANVGVSRQEWFDHLVAEELGVDLGDRVTVFEPGEATLVARPEGPQSAEQRQATADMWARMSANASAAANRTGGSIGGRVKAS